MLEVCLNTHWIIINLGLSLEPLIDIKARMRFITDEVKYTGISFEPLIDIKVKMYFFIDMRGSKKKNSFFNFLFNIILKQFFLIKMKKIPNIIIGKELRVIEKKDK